MKLIITSLLFVLSFSSLANGSIVTEEGSKSPTEISYGPGYPGGKKNKRKTRKGNRANRKRNKMCKKMHRNRA